MLDHYARKAAENHLDSAQNVDATAWPVHVTHPDGHALDRTGVPAELFAESSANVGAVIVVEGDAVDSDVGRRGGWSRPTRNPLGGPGHLSRKRLSLGVCLHVRYLP